MTVKTRKKVAPYHQQPYDSTLKALFEASTHDMLDFTVGSPVKRVTELSGEALKPPLRVDRSYKGWYKGRAHIVHVELETDGKGEMGFRVIKLWEIDAHSFLAKRRASLYALLPTMRGADYALLSHALDAMKKFYGNQSRMLATKLVLFQVFLKRTDTISEEDRSRIMQKIEMYADLMAQSPFVQRTSAAARAEGKIEGKVEGIAEGRIEMRKIDILSIVKARFPRLTRMAQRKVGKITKMQTLDEIFSKLIIATDEQAVRFIFDGLRS